MDLTKITTPFGLLDEETQKALVAHGGPYETYEDQGWSIWIGPLGDYPATVYRVKPAPPKPREWWTVGAHMHGTKAKAEKFRWDCARDHGDHHMKTPIIHVVEVLE